MIDSRRDIAEPSKEGFAELIAAARHGTDSDVGHLLEATRRYLLLVANRSLDAPLQQKVAPSDLVQETFLDAHRDFRRFTGESDGELLGWLCHILMHKAADAGRRFRGTAKRDLKEELPLAASSGCPAQQVASSDPTPSAVAISCESGQRLHAALARLPAEYRRVIELRSLERLPFVEVGNRLQRSEDAAGKLWFRALQRLKQELAASDDSRASYAR